MKTTKEGKDLIKSYEGLSLSAFYDVTGYAIGYGQHTYSNGTIVQAKDKITKATADAEFDRYIAKFEPQVSRYITSNVSDIQFSALVSYAYNRGLGAFSGSNLLKMVNANPNDSRIIQQFATEWGTTTKYKTALIKRRKAEAEFYSKGSFSPKQSGFVATITDNIWYIIASATVGAGFYWAFKLGGRYVIQSYFSKLLT